MRHVNNGGMVAFHIFQVLSLAWTLTLRLLHIRQKEYSAACMHATMSCARCLGTGRLEFLSTPTSVTRNAKL